MNQEVRLEGIEVDLPIGNIAVNLRERKEVVHLIVDRENRGLDREKGEQKGIVRKINAILEESRDHQNVIKAKKRKKIKTKVVIKT